MKKFFWLKFSLSFLLIPLFFFCFQIKFSQRKLAFLASPVNATTDYFKHKGVVFKPWDQTNTDFAQTCPNCGPMGGIYFVNWNQIHTGQKSFNFGRIINILNAAKQMKTVPFPDGRRIEKPMFIEISFFRGDSPGDYTPAWVYARGAAPKSVTCNGKTINAPPYDSDIWKYSFYEMVRGVGEYFEAHKSEYPNLAGFIFGTGYDDEAYPAGSGCDYPNIGSYYHSFLQGLAKNAHETFPTIPVYLVTGGQSFNKTLTEAAEQYKVGLKSNTIHDGAGEANMFSYSGSGSCSQIAGNPQYLTKDFPWSAAALTNEKVSWAFEDARSFQFAGGQNAYAQLMMIMSFKADWMDFRDIAAFQELAKANASFLNNFVPSYLGQTKSRTPGVWIGFRDIRNPTIFTNEWTRGQEIQCWGSCTCHTHTFGDFEFYLKRVGQDSSEKVFLETGQTYGFGRKIPASSQMTLKVEDGVWFKNESRNAKLRLVVLNSGSGSIEIAFKKADGTIHTETIDKGSSLGVTGKFVEVERLLPAVKFDGSMGSGGDIIIRAVGGESILHLFEIRPTLTPVATNTPVLTPTLTLTPTPTQTTSASSSSFRGFSAGWNSLSWNSSWSSLSFSNLPSECPFIVYKKDGFFKAYARGYSKDEMFTSGVYYIFCRNEVSWHP